MNFFIIFIFLSLDSVKVWTFNQGIYTQEKVDSALYVYPQYCKRGWFKYAHIPFNYFPYLGNIPPLLNEKGALLEGGVQVANVKTDAGWPYDNPYGPDHQPPYKIPDPVFYDFITRDADGNIFWIPNIYENEITCASIANENYWEYVLFWAYQEIDANVNALEFDEINGGYRFSQSGIYGDNPNTGYDDYAIGIANFASRISVISQNDSLYFVLPSPSASSELDSAKFAFDDDLSTMWISEEADSHWIEIDFKRERTVKQIYLILSPSNILRNFEIKFLRDTEGVDFNPPITVISNSDTLLSFLFERVSTQRIRLFSPDSQVYLPEFQIFGYGFRQFLLEKYVELQGWTPRDP